MSYPHYVGTIQGFIDKFLAFPWLKSCGYNVKMVDSDVCKNIWWGKLNKWTRKKLDRKYITPNKCCIINTAFDVKWDNGKDLPITDPGIIKQLQNAYRYTAQEGYFCFNDMYLWGQELLEENPQVISYIRQRFPLLFMDEVQDNDEKQSDLLHKIFIYGDSPVIRQRFGDSNQAIFNFQGQKGATVDLFPGSSKHDLPSSFRFGQQIANFADPLGLKPHGLIGNGPGGEDIKTDTSKNHAIFLFPKELTNQVIPAYCNYLLDVFKDEEINHENFSAVAVGAVHKSEIEEKRCPHSVVHYWPDYHKNLSSVTPRPKHFSQYVEIGQRDSSSAGESRFTVEKIAEAFLKLANLVGKDFKIGNRKNRHRQILEVLREDSPALKKYQSLLHQWAIDKKELKQDDWDTKYKNEIKNIIESLCNAKCDWGYAGDFLKWSDKEEVTGGDNRKKPSVNICHHHQNDREVCVRLGSIHSVKGETHTAILVLETFSNDYQLDKLKNWLKRERFGEDSKSGVRDIDRLKMHYVAMTRPSHLLCLAMKDESLSPEEIDTLKNNGFRVGKVQDEGKYIWV